MNTDLERNCPGAGCSTGCLRSRVEKNPADTKEERSSCSCGGILQGVTDGAVTPGSPDADIVVLAGRHRAGDGSCTTWMLSSSVVDSWAAHNQNVHSASAERSTVAIREGIFVLQILR